MTTNPKPTRAVIWYRRLVQCYPRRYQQQYAEPLVQLFGDIYRDATNESPTVRRQILTRTYLDTASGIGREQVSHLKEIIMPTRTATKLPKNRFFKYQWLIISLAGFAAVIFVIQAYVFQPFKIAGTSMSPTYKDGQYVLVSKLPYLSHNHLPNRGQTIVFKFPKDPSSIFVKRVIGLPGDHVVISAGQVSVTNQTISSGTVDDTLNKQQTAGNVDVVVPTNTVFVLGDNRAPGGSYDSREWGNLPIGNIIGSVGL